MHISEEGLALIKHFEGCPTDDEGNVIAYQDAVDIWTIGYGHTKGVQEGDKWTQEKADFMLWRELEEEYENYIKDYVHVPLNQNQFDALCSWVYNLGPNNLKVSTLLKKLNNGEYDEVPAQIKRWNKAGGKVLEGLVRRREAEALMFEGKEWL
jgi:lysozyme